jgi:hypothetical protein
LICERFVNCEWPEADTEREVAEWTPQRVALLSCESFFFAIKNSSRSPMNAGNVSMEDWKSKRSLTLNNVNMAAPNETVKKKPSPPSGCASDTLCENVIGRSVTTYGEKLHGVLNAVLDEFGVI